MRVNCEICTNTHSKMKLTIALTLLVCLWSTTSSLGLVDDLEYCYSTESNPYRYYGSITAYNEFLQTPPYNATVPGKRNGVARFTELTNTSE